MKKKYGYCAVTADIVHIGHVRYINKCKAMCEKLIVGIMTDDCVEKYKGKRPVVNQWDRREIVGNLKDVGFTLFQDTFEFPHHVTRMKNFHEGDFIIFDCKDHARKGHDVLLDREPGVSSTEIKAHEDFNYSERSL